MSAAAPPEGDAAGAGDVPVRAAASVVVVDDRPDLHVLLGTRRAGSAFVGGLVVFPGGGLDPTDRHEASVAVVRGASAVAGLSAVDVAAHLVAGLRETLEEVGVWLGGARPEVVARRRDLEADAVTLAELVGAGAVDAAAHPHVGRWITPIGPPRRYDTHFFLARHPGGEVSPDGTEIVEVGWWRPGDALDAIDAGELAAITPTISFLTALAEHRDVDAALAAAGRRLRRDDPMGWTAL